MAALSLGLVMSQLVVRALVIDLYVTLTLGSAVKVDLYVTLTLGSAVKVDLYVTLTLGSAIKVGLYVTLTLGSAVKVGLYVTLTLGSAVKVDLYVTLTLGSAVKVDLYVTLTLGSAVKVLSQPGNTVQFPCDYSYEDHQDIPQLSVQWRGPSNTLLCHYIKHKVFRNCTQGYSLDYTPRKITLSITEVRTQDFGSHVCSVSKRHEFTDFSIELAVKTDPITSLPTNRWAQSGLPEGHLVVLVCSVLVSTWG
ncbi:uncharacterized protein LOC118965059 [Oncorhynchus mykiss]|uniref:uncharacterized protein LOC118965059 n=1 Tax=Oncorhynchus mykiss TaxID=8022 RepID=UPI0018778B54|nr:uncharacterized protein LOC118965059 [Oncorhynchus mykiss]